MYITMHVSLMVCLCHLSQQCNIISSTHSIIMAHDTLFASATFELTMQLYTLPVAHACSLKTCDGSTQKSMTEDITSAMLSIFGRAGAILLAVVEVSHA